tara:strand:+ start:804 stop:1970 length:1167 start_codon:yes stop_codon:yes gene_type:complete
MADSLSITDKSIYIAQQSAQDDLTTPVFTEFRVVDGSPKKSVSYTQSAIVDPSGQAPDQVFEDFTLEGSLESEFNDSSVDYLRRAIHGNETLVNVTGVDIATTATGFNSGSSNAFADLFIGDYFKVSGFTDPLLNVWHRIETKTDANNITTSVAPSSVEATGASVTIYSRKTTSGKTRYYDIVQERIRDTSQSGDIAHKSFYNGAIDTATVTINDKGILGFSLGYLFEKLLDQLTPISGQTDAASDLSNSYSSALNVTGYYANGISQLCEFASMTIEITNQYSSLSASGCSAKILGKQPINVSASISALAFDDAPFKWIAPSENSTDTSFAVKLSNDAKTQDVLIAMDRCKITDSGLEKGDVFYTNPFTALAQSSNNQDTTITIYTNY